MDADVWLDSGSDQNSPFASRHLIFFKRSRLAEAEAMLHGAMDAGLHPPTHGPPLSFTGQIFTFKPPSPCTHARTVASDPIIASLRLNLRRYSEQTLVRSSVRSSTLKAHKQKNRIK